MNSICISGRVTSPPSFYPHESGNHRCTFVLAHNEWRGGEQRSAFFFAKAWGSKAQAIRAHCTTGTELFLSGRLEQWRCEEEDGRITYLNSIVVDRFDFGRRSGKPEGELPS
ncbi:MAG: single-stranded DNA-binding protein [Spirochaetales bacterium]|nr:single-stranded DNA-binding protein [Leptospiraceae bacterium]MCP5482709.1 single-stranded DNA-binding protein [Spirochaetales bacterium]